MAKSAVTEESCQHGQGARRESLIDERLLAFESLDRRTTRQRIFADRFIGNLRIELGDRSQPFRLPTVPAVQRLAQNKLSARCIVSEIEPIRNIARSLHYASLDHTARRSRVHTPDQKIRIPIMI
jgi:hypothetical protein